MGHAGKDTGKISIALKKIGLSLVFLFAILSRLQSQPCKLKIDQDSIKVYTCHTDTSLFKSIVAEFTLNATFDQLTRLVMNIPAYTRWQYNTVEADAIKIISDSEQIYHNVIKAPWPVADRDMVVRIKTSYHPDHRSLVITTESEAKTIPKKAGCVRVPSSFGRWMVTMKNKNQLHISYTMQIDPGGSVPAWLVNWACAQAPYQSFKNLKRILEKENQKN